MGGLWLGCFGLILWAMGGALTYAGLRELPHWKIFLIYLLGVLVCFPVGGFLLYIS